MASFFSAARREEEEEEEATLEDPFEDVVELDGEKAPNELLVSLGRGRGLKATDTDFFGTKSADPRVRFVVKGTKCKKEPSVVSATKTNTLSPVWNQSLVVRFQSDETLALACYVEDWDVAGVDRMGKLTIPLTKKKKKKKKMKWYDVEPQGQIEFAFMWWYNPQADVYDPFRRERRQVIDPFLAKLPNELRVACFRAKNLTAADKSFLTGKKTTSDPRLTVTVKRPSSSSPGQEDDETKEETAEETAFDVAYSTETRSATLRPVWKELLVIEHCRPPRGASTAADFPMVQVVVEDVDLGGSTTLLGKLELNLGDLFLAHKLSPTTPFEWYPFDHDDDSAGGAVELSFHWRYNKDIDPHRDEKNHNLISMLTPDILEDAIETAVQKGEEIFYDIANTMILIADVYEISQEWKLAVDAISVIVGLTPTVNDAISEAQDIASIFIKILAAATGNPAAIAHLLYTGYKALNNSKHIFALYDESGRFVEAMLVVEHFVVVVMDVIRRGYVFYSTHFAKMEKKERKEAKGLWGKKKKKAFDLEPEWSTRKALYPRERPNCLYVGLVRARDLAIKDHYLIMRGGSSDPQMNFQLTTPSMTLAQQSTCKTQTLKPQWNETFAFDVEAPDEKDIISKFFFSDERPPSHDPDAKDNATIPDLTISEEDAAADTSSSSSSPKKGQQDHKGRRGKPLVRKAAADVASKKQQKEWRLECDLVDVDVGKEADSLGAVTVDVLPLRNQRLYKRWHLLRKARLHAEGDEEIPKKIAQDAYFWDQDDAQDDGKISGEVELLVRWLYDPSKDPWVPPSFTTLADDASSSESAVVNECLLIGLFQCRDLPAMDDNVLLDDSSDPFLTFQIFRGDEPASTKAQSTTKYQTLFPVYREELVLRGGPWKEDDGLVLRVVAEDFDLTSKSDNLGAVDIPLKEIRDKQQQGEKFWRAWHTLVLPKGVVPVNQKDIEARGNPPAQVELFLKLGANSPSPPEEEPTNKSCLAGIFGAPSSSLFGAPPSPELADGRLDDDPAEEVLVTKETTPHRGPLLPSELRKAAKSAEALQSTLLKDSHKLTELVSSYKSFLCDPGNRRGCLDLAKKLRTAILAHRLRSSERSLRLQVVNLVRFPLLSLPGCRRRRRRCGALSSSSSSPGRRRRLRAFFLLPWRRGFLDDESLLGGGGAPPSAEGESTTTPPLSQDEVRPSVHKASKTSFVASHAFMADLESSLANMVKDVVNVMELYNDLTRMNKNWNAALKALAFVENTIPEIVSALETIQSIIQVILKAIQGISFPPNPAVLVDMLHTMRSIFKQAKSVYKVYCRHHPLTKAVGVLSLFAKHLVDAISRCANLLSGEDGDGLCGCC